MERKINFVMPPIIDGALPGGLSELGQVFSGSLGALENIFRGVWEVV